MNGKEEIEELQHVYGDHPHQRPADLDPKVNGPFLDDIRAEQANARREGRSKQAEGK